MTSNGDQPAGELTTSTSPAARTNSPNPDHSTTLSVREAAQRSGVHPNTVRRKVKAGQVPGAFLAPGPMGDEWRIPVTSLASLTPNRPHPRAATAAAASDEQAELEKLRHEIELVKAEAARYQNEVTFLRDALSEAISKLPPALPAPVSLRFPTQVPDDDKWFRWRRRRNRAE